MPCEPPDTPENLPKERRRQVAFRQLPDKVPGISDWAPARLEEPLLQLRERPALDGERHAAACLCVSVTR
jgi:hypothetical protein